MNISPKKKKKEIVWTKEQQEDEGTMVEHHLHSGSFNGVPGARGYLLGVGLSFRHTITVLCPNLLCDSTELRHKKC